MVGSALLLAQALVLLIVSDRWLERISRQATLGTQYLLYVMCVCCTVITFILDVRLVDVPTGVTQEEGHAGLLHLPSSAVLALIFLARRIHDFD